MKITFFFIIFAVFTLNSYADAINTGNILSVNSLSRLNALRNPAIMSRQQDENFTFLHQYSYLMNENSDIDIKFGILTADSKFSVSEDFNGSLLFSNVSRSGKNSYGIGITRLDDGQVAFSSIESSIKLSNYSITTIEDKTFIGSALMLSYSYDLNSRESVGLQIETRAFYDSRTTEKKGSEVSTLKAVKQRFSSGGTLGYYFLDNNYEFGAMVKTGRYGIENQKYELNKNSSVINNKISNYYINEEGLGALIGFGLKPSRKLLVSIETGYTIPYSHKEKECDEEKLIETPIDINLNYAYALKGGVNYVFSRYLTLGFGGCFMSFKSDSSDKTSVKTDTNNYKIYQIGTGFDIFPSKNYTLIFGLDYRIVFAGIETETSESSFKLKLKEDYYDIIAGISCNY